MCLSQHFPYLSPAAWSSLSCHLESLPTDASGSFIKLIQLTWKHNPTASLSLEGSLGLTLRPTKLKRTGACSVFDAHWLILRRNDGLQAISTPPPTSAAFQNFYLEEDYPSIVGFNGECMDIPLQPAPGDWPKCPTLPELLDYSPAIPVGQARRLHTEERLVGAKCGGRIWWHQQNRYEIPTEWTSHIWARTTIKKASVSSSGLFSWDYKPVTIWSFAELGASFQVTVSLALWPIAVWLFPPKSFSNKPFLTTAFCSSTWQCTPRENPLGFLGAWLEKPVKTSTCLHQRLHSLNGNMKTSFTRLWEDHGFP